MERKSLSRRDFMRLSALAAAGGILAACQPAEPQVVKETVVVEKEVEVPVEVEVEKTVVVEEIVEKEVTAVPEPGEPVEFEFWAQDWGPWLAICAEVERQVEDMNPNWDFVVRPLPWGDLTTKLVTAAAAGTEGDGFASYTYLWRQVATSELLLPLSPLISRAELEEIVFPEVLDELQEVGQELYFIPILSGFDGGAITINAEHFDEGTDFDAIATWEELVDLAVDATQRDDAGNMTRQGLVVNTFAAAAQFCLSQGATFYNLDQRRFELTIPEMEYAANEIWKLYNEYNCSDLDFELGTQDIFGSRLASMVNYGPYTLSGVEASQPDMKVTQIVTPPLGMIEPEDQRFWQNALFGVSMSRRLARDTAKMAVGAAALDIFLKPESLLMFLDFYSGGVCSPGVYESPDLENYKYGAATKDFGDRLWRRMVIVGNIIQEPYDIMSAEMQRMIRNEATVMEALTSLNDQLNVLEAEAVARKFGT